MSRGLTEKDAMKLLVRAKFNTILEGITKNDVKELVSNAIDSKL